MTLNDHVRYEKTLLTTYNPGRAGGLKQNLPPKDISGLKNHYGHKILTSQKACLEVHTTVSKDSRDKKRFAVLRMTKNTTFGAKHY